MRNGPFSNVRVLDMTQILAGPYTGQLLGDLGADVIKIEQPGTGESSRKFAPYFLNGESAYFLGFNRKKRSCYCQRHCPDHHGRSDRDRHAHLRRPGLQRRAGHHPAPGPRRPHPHPHEYVRPPEQLHPAGRALIYLHGGGDRSDRATSRWRTAAPRSCPAPKTGGKSAGSTGTS